MHNRQNVGKVIKIASAPLELKLRSFDENELENMAGQPTKRPSLQKQARSSVVQGSKHEFKPTTSAKRQTIKKGASRSEYAKERKSQNLQTTSTAQPKTEMFPTKIVVRSTGSHLSSNEGRAVNVIGLSKNPTIKPAPLKKHSRNHLQVHTSKNKGVHLSPHHIDTLETDKYVRKTESRPILLKKDSATVYDSGRSCAQDELKPLSTSAALAQSFQKAAPWLFKIFSTPPVEIKDPEANKVVKALGLSQKQLRHLRTIFDTIDIDRAGSIDQKEFLDMLEEKEGPFTDALFKLVDADNSGTIDFGEFLRSFLIYGIYNREDILLFCFQIFDADRSGAIDEEEFIELANVVNGATPMFPGNFKTALEQFDSNSDGLINFEEFKSMDKRFPLLFFPAFRLQDQMQKKTLGLKAWKKNTECY